MGDFSTSTQRRAAKNHKCFECGRMISKGESYEVVAGVWDGNFMTLKTCAHCQVLRKVVGSRDEFFYDESYYGGLSEYEFSEVGSIAIDDADHLMILRLWAGFRKRWVRHDNGETVTLPYAARCERRVEFGYHDGPNGEPAQGDTWTRWFWLDSLGIEIPTTPSTPTPEEPK